MLGISADTPFGSASSLITALFLCCLRLTEVIARPAPLEHVWPYCAGLPFLYLSRIPVEDECNHSLASISALRLTTPLVQFDHAALEQKLFD